MRVKDQSEQGNLGDVVQQTSMAKLTVNAKKAELTIFNSDIDRTTSLFSHELLRMYLYRTLVVHILSSQQIT